MPGKRYTLVLNFGYVENSRLSFMPWRSTATFKDAKAALLDLALFLRDQYLATNTKKLKRCCETTKSKESSARFCTKCGQNLEEPTIDGERFIEWLRDLDTDVDQFHGLIPWDTNHRWKSEGLEGTSNQRFVYQAEWVIAAAVGYPPNKDITFEVICTNRTIARQESFSYC